MNIINLEDVVAHLKSLSLSNHSPSNLILSAGLSALIQRHRPEDRALIDAVLLVCRQESNLDEIIDDVQTGLFALSEQVEQTAEHPERQSELWHSLYLQIGALFFMQEQDRFAKTIRQILAGIGPNWTLLEGSARDLFKAHPPIDGDLTADFLAATIHSSEVVFEDNSVPFPVPWLRQLLNPKEVPAIDINKLSASGAGVEPSLNVLFFGEGWQLSLLSEDGYPKEFILDGIQRAEAFHNNQLMQAEVDGNALVWPVQDGRWRFSIQSQAYELDLNYGQ